MSFVYGTNCELLYSMPVAGTAYGASTGNKVLSGSAAGNPAYQMPALQNIWPISSMIGKALRFVARGTYDSTAVASTFSISMDGTQGTQGAAILGSTGSFTLASNTVGLFEMELDATCTTTGTAANVGTSTWFTGGIFTLGAANNAATTAAVCYMVGGLNALGVPAAGVTLATGTQFYPEMWANWAVAPVTAVLTQFLVFALN